MVLFKMVDDFWNLSNREVSDGLLDLGSTPRAGVPPASPSAGEQIEHIDSRHSASACVGPDGS